MQWSLVTVQWMITQVTPVSHDVLSVVRGAFITAPGAGTLTRGQPSHNLQHSSTTKTQSGSNIAYPSHMKKLQHLRKQQLQMLNYFWLKVCENCIVRWQDLPVHFFVLGKHEVVAGEGYAEDYGGDALEAVDPLLSLWPLAAHVKHPGNWRVREITIIFSGYDPSIPYLQGLKL